ncbi:hypothetical protein AJ79_00519 [Helicocarpus griseus UAMH5409]|uniref:Uncharacterized protein n=1 Tax=Helicocarpus griseus UAMH5409 TaxID=1447875 RepID=A0A2B7YBI2_9EURO|nr:hypothetical protein AJ79_00519 [Helicocarpus griseus UAMH5409]
MPPQTSKFTELLDPDIVKQHTPSDADVRLEDILAAEATVAATTTSRATTVARRSSTSTSSSFSSSSSSGKDSLGSRFKSWLDEAVVKWRIEVE